jgi:hypothetical protein
MNEKLNPNYGQIPFWRKPQISRRVFFRHAGSAVGGYFLLPTRPMESVAKAGAPEPLNKARYVIFVMMLGGPSHIDTFNHKVVADVTPANFSSTNYGGDQIDTSLWFPGDAGNNTGLMPNIAKQLDSIVLLRSFRSWGLVHPLNQLWAQIGRNPTSSQGRISPHIGSIVSLELAQREPGRNPVLPTFMFLNANSGPASGFLGPQYGPFFFSPNGNALPDTTHRPAGDSADVGRTRFENNRYPLLMRLDQEMRSGLLGPSTGEVAVFTEKARNLMYNADVDNVFALDAVDRDRYGGVDEGGARNSFSDACITARNLLRGERDLGLGTRFVQINIGGWDNHQQIYNNANNLNAGNPRSNGRKFDYGLGNLIQDLKTDGMLNDTLIVCMGEFGRTVGNGTGQLNRNNGRDHYLQQAVLVAGANIQGNRPIGYTDDFGAAVPPGGEGWERGRQRRGCSDPDCAHVGPYIRDVDLEATIYSALGIDYTKILLPPDAPLRFEYVPNADPGIMSDPRLYGPIYELWPKG